MVTLKHNPSHVRRHMLPYQPSQHLTLFRLNTHNPSQVLQHQKQTQYSMLQIKPYSKHTFRLSPSYFFIILLLFLTNLARGLTTLSEETTQRKHTYVTPIFLGNNKLSLATNKPTSPAKIIPQKLWLQLKFGLNLLDLIQEAKDSLTELERSIKNLVF